MSNASLWAGASSEVQYRVHLGTWTDWSRGNAITGSTLTLKREQGSLLIAFTAFFVGLVSTCFWRIVRLVLHRLYSTPDSRDALHHQRQALLRNSVTPASSLWSFTLLGWSWRRHGSRGVTRMMPVVVCAGVCIAAFTVAGGFSSQLSSGLGNAVLVNGSHCGYLMDTYEVGGSALGIYPYLVGKMANAANYAQQCYSSKTSGMFACSTFVRDHLPASVDDEAPCPFSGGICRSNDSNLRLDTGLLDSQHHLGVNSRPEQRIFFRSVLHCAPLVTEGYTSQVRTGARNYTRYHYGRSTRFNQSSPVPRNFTMQVESQYDQYHRETDNPYENPDGSAFRLRALHVQVVRRTPYLTNSFSDFDPIPQLFRPDGELLVVFLSGNGVLFSSPSPDPWYRGTKEGKSYRERGSNRLMTLYETQEAASPLACLHQAQFCDGSLRCGPLASFVDAAAGAAPLFNSTAEVAMPENVVKPQGETASRFVWFIVSVVQGASSLASGVASLGSDTLQAKQYLFGGVVLDSLRHQWRSDVSHWYAMMLASIQETFVSMASKPADPDLERYLIRPTNTWAQDMCDNQKILSSQFASFSLFGLYLTYLVGLIIIATSHAVEPVFAILARRRNRPPAHPYLEWTANETLQLQRAAYEGLGSGTWTGLGSEIPKTERGEKLSDLTARYTRVVDAEGEYKATGTSSNQAQQSSSSSSPDRGQSRSVRCRDVEDGLAISTTASSATVTCCTEEPHRAVRLPDAET